MTVTVRVRMGVRVRVGVGVRAGVKGAREDGVRVSKSVAVSVVMSVGAGASANTSVRERMIRCSKRVSAECPVACSAR